MGGFGCGVSGQERAVEVMGIRVEWIEMSHLFLRVVTMCLRCSGAPEVQRHIQAIVAWLLLGRPGSKFD